MNITSTRDVNITQGVKALIYGGPDAGKTRLLATLDHPTTLIISSEHGLISLKDVAIDVHKVSTMAAVQKLNTELRSPAMVKYKHVAVDSITDIAQILLHEALQSVADGRKAQYIVQDAVLELLRTLRDLDKNVFVIAWQREYQGKITPQATGSILSEMVAHFFDMAFHLARWEVDDGTNTGKLVTRRFLQTTTVNGIFARDRSNILAQFEPADLTAVLTKLAQSA